MWRGMNEPQLKEYAGGHIHMIGIGGSSMSGLAEMLIDQGYSVSGSDRTDGYLMNDVRQKGATVYIGHRAENVDGADLVVYTAAIPRENPELLEARKRGIPTMERAELLGQLMQGFPWAIGICGAHGKTTTTSMLSQILVHAGMDPSIHIGGKLDFIGGSTRVGHGDIFLAEACEFNRSFLHMNPTMEVVLNIDADHLDCYKDLDEIETTFGQYMQKVPHDGVVIGRGTDPRVVRQMASLQCRKVTFGLTEACAYHPGNLQEDAQGYAEFDLMHDDACLGHVQMRVPGMFNVENALAALSAAAELGCDTAGACRAISEFQGAHRRFECTDQIDGVEIFHDYGHNPQEMRNALSIGRKRCRGRLIAVMQPHTYSRVRTLFQDYLTCTEIADITLVTDICAAREKDPGDLNSGMLVDGMREHGIEAYWTPTFDDTEQWLRAHWQPGDLVLTMGCGDINLLNVQIHRHEEEKKKQHE